MSDPDANSGLTKYLDAIYSADAEAENDANIEAIKAKIIDDKGNIMALIDDMICSEKFDDIIYRIQEAKRNGWETSLMKAAADLVAMFDDEAYDAARRAL